MARALILNLLLAVVAVASAQSQSYPALVGLGGPGYAAVSCLDARRAFGPKPDVVTSMRQERVSVAFHDDLVVVCSPAGQTGTPTFYPTHLTYIYQGVPHGIGEEDFLYLAGDPGPFDSAHRFVVAVRLRGIAPPATVLLSYEGGPAYPATFGP